MPVFYPSAGSVCLDPCFSFFTRQTQGFLCTLHSWFHRKHLCNSLTPHIILLLISTLSRSHHLSLNSNPFHKYTRLQLCMGHRVLRQVITSGKSINFRFCTLLGHSYKALLGKLYQELQICMSRTQGFKAIRSGSVGGWRMVDCLKSG